MPGSLWLEGVAADNAARTECVSGHPFDEQNTYQRTGGGRTCRACDRLWHQRAYARRKWSDLVTRDQPGLAPDHAQNGSQTGYDVLETDAITNSSRPCTYDAVGDAEALASPAEDA